MQLRFALSPKSLIVAQLDAALQWTKLRRPRFALPPKSLIVAQLPYRNPKPLFRLLTSQGNFKPQKRLKGTTGLPRRVLGLGFRPCSSEAGIARLQGIAAWAAYHGLCSAEAVIRV